MLEIITHISLSFLTTVPHLECPSHGGAFGKGVAGKFTITKNVLELSTVKEVSCVNNEQKLWFYLFSRNVNFYLFQRDKK